eukprot:snap_masked-scaffold_1-processed-gene-2.26-mRNA-1 protein AED:1.00 eAED:1.00 QI:0/-1/0/0/-1/1/1/0/83
MNGVSKIESLGTRSIKPGVSAGGLWENTVIENVKNTRNRFLNMFIFTSEVIVCFFVLCLFPKKQEVGAGNYAPKLSHDSNIFH